MNASVVEIGVQALGAISTAASVLFAIMVFRRQQDEKQFSALRVDLVQYRNLFSAIDHLFSSVTAAEIGAAMREHISVVALDKTKPVDTITDDDIGKHLVYEAFSIAIQNSSAAQQRGSHLREIKRISNAHREKFPVLSGLLEDFADYFDRIGSSHTTASEISDIFTDRFAAAKKSFLESVEGKSPEESLARLSILFSDFISARYSVGQSYIDTVEVLANTIIDHYVSANDKSLRRISSIEQRERTKNGKILFQDASKDISGRLDLIEPIFEKTVWTKLVEYRTKLNGLGK